MEMWLLVRAGELERHARPLVSKLQLCRGCSVMRVRGATRARGPHTPDLTGLCLSACLSASLTQSVPWRR